MLSKARNIEVTGEHRMFRRPTVFVIGAGAGVEFNMPTGEALTDQIARKVEFRFEHWNQTHGDKEIWHALKRISELRRLDEAAFSKAGRAIAKGIHYSKSIDSYIHAHQHDECVKICGKTAIVHSIVEHEKECHLFMDSKQRTKRFKRHDELLRTWVRDFVGILQEGISAKGNLDQLFENVAIVNFNYDRCIEHYLYNVIQDFYLLNEERAANLMSTLKIFHPYGVVSPLPWQNRELGIEFGGDPYGNALDLDLLAENIKTYNEEVKDNESLSDMRSLFAKATRIVFLGFHFHPQNVRLLKSDGSEAKWVRHVYFTAYDRSGPDIEHITQAIHEMFSPPSPQLLSTHPFRGECRTFFKEYGTVLGA